MESTPPQLHTLEVLFPGGIPPGGKQQCVALTSKRHKACMHSHHELSADGCYLPENSPTLLTCLVGGLAAKDVGCVTIGCLTDGRAQEHACCSCKDTQSTTASDHLPPKNLLRLSASPNNKALKLRLGPAVRPHLLLSLSPDSHRGHSPLCTRLPVLDRLSCEGRAVLEAAGCERHI